MQCAAKNRAAWAAESSEPFYIDQIERPSARSGRAKLSGVGGSRALMYSMADVVLLLEVDVPIKG